MEQQLLSFRPNTRQKRLRVGSIEFGLGNSKSILLPEIGYLSRIHLFFNGSITYSATSTPADKSPYSIFKRISVTLNNSATDIFNTSGYGLFLLNSVNNKGGRLDQQPDFEVYQYPTSGTSASLNLGLTIPISLSQGYNFESGLINLQAPEIQCQLNIDFLNSLTEIGNAITSLTGNVTAYYEYYEVPSPVEVLQPPVVLHRVIEQIQPVNATGENIFTLPRGGQLNRLIHVLTLNGTRTDLYDDTTVRFNQSETIYKQDKRLHKLLQRERYGYPLPTGVFVHDFAYGFQHPEESDLRDAINTEMITTTDSIVNVSSSAALGTNNNFFTSVREILQTAQPI